MSNASATGASMSSDHLLALRERETIASVLARGATQDLVVNGNLDRVWMFCDAFRLSDALGYGPAFAFTYHFLREIGIRDPGELPDPEVWKAICGKPYVAKLSAETTARLDGKAAFVAALLSGRLEFPYGNMPPLSGVSQTRI